MLTKLSLSNWFRRWHFVVHPINLFAVQLWVPFCIYVLRLSDNFFSRSFRLIPLSTLRWYNGHFIVNVIKCSAGSRNWHELFVFSIRFPFGHESFMKRKRRTNQNVFIASMWMIGQMPFNSVPLSLNWWNCVWHFHVNFSLDFGRIQKRPRSDAHVPSESKNIYGAWCRWARRTCGSRRGCVNDMTLECIECEVREVVEGLQL